MVRVVPTSIKAVLEKGTVFAYPSKFTIVGETEESVKDAVSKLTEIETLTSDRVITRGFEFYNDCYKAIVDVSSESNKTLPNDVVTLMKEKGYQLVIEQSFMEENIESWISEDIKQLIAQSVETNLESQLLIVCTREVGIEYTCMCDEMRANYEILNIRDEVKCPIEVIA